MLLFVVQVSELQGKASSAEQRALALQEALAKQELAARAQAQAAEAQLGALTEQLNRASQVGGDVAFCQGRWPAECQTTCVRQESLCGPEGPCGCGVLFAGG